MTTKSDSRAAASGSGAAATTAAVAVAVAVALCVELRILSIRVMGKGCEREIWILERESERKKRIWGFGFLGEKGDYKVEENEVLYR